MALVKPFNMVGDVWPHRYLLFQLIKRDVLLKYRGAMFGVAWVFLSPLFMLAVFGYVFGHVYPTRWPTESNLPHWLQLFAGLITFNLFAETVSRAPSAVRSYPSYVKKIIFPLQILPLVPLGAGLVHLVFNTIIFLVALLWVGQWHWQIFLLPVLLIPVVLLALGSAWFIGAWGVFIKDLTQVVPMAIQVLMFVSPVFYPVEAVPAKLRPFYEFNPLGSVIEANRAAAAGSQIAWGAWLLALAVGLIAALLGYWFFKHASEEFADVL